MATERHFGRLAAPDARDRNFPMRLMLDPLRATAFPRGIPPGTRHYPKGRMLNQGPTGTCVEHGWTAKIEGAPFMQKTGLAQYDLYRRIVKNDEWRSNDREATAPVSGLQHGTSVRAGAITLQQMGLIESFLWAEDIEDARAWHLRGLGGLVIGITWKSAMMETDSDGFINYKGRDEGGHCVATVGWSDFVKHNGRKVPAVRIQQSWGRPWGHGGSGYAWLEANDFGMAIADNGEICAATEIRVKKLTPVTIGGEA